MEPIVQREAGAALRARSLPRLQEGFSRYVGTLSPEPEPRDWRDELVCLVPFVDCARRLGHDPRTVLGPLTNGVPWLPELFATLAARTDVTLAAFGWSIEETDAGPAYRAERMKPHW